METVQKASNRNSKKRKAHDAEIDIFDNNDAKRIKKHPLKDEQKDDPFAKFVDSQSDGFSSLLKKSAESQSSSPSITNAKTEESKEQKSEQQEIAHTEDNPFGSFGSFASFESFSLERASTGSAEFQWGNKSNDNEFTFGDTSEFSFAEFEKNMNNKNKKNEKELIMPEKDEPIALLTGQVDAGDTEDQTLYEIKCKVWQFNTEKNEWNEKGIGKIKINTYMNNNKLNARLLCRTDVTFKTIINGIIKKDTSFIKQNEQNIKFTIFEQVVNQQETTNNKQDGGDKNVSFVTKTYCFKSKELDKTKIDKFLNKIKEIKQKMLDDD